jgi:hypothetical protein
MIIVSALVLTLGVLGFVLFIRVQDIPEPLPVSPVQHLEDRKQAIYDNLRDLQFEYRLGKLSDEDYQQNKLALQKELAVVLAEMESTMKQLGLTSARGQVKAPASKREPAAATTCPHCGANFPQKLKFCGECGKAIA